MDLELRKHRGTETLLIADDDKHVLNLLSDYLSYNGYNVIKAKDGEEAVEAYKKNSVDIQLVMMDIVMPRKDGIKASLEIIEHNPDAIIWFMSGYNPDANCELIGKRFIKKPFSPIKIAEVIRNLLDGNSCDYVEWQTCI